ncbi:GNAT family N-acetyltransferase [Actinophytocola sediminis]
MLTNLTLTVHTGDTSSLDPVMHMYSEIYAEPPYHEDSDDVEQFAQHWVSWTGTAGFTLALAQVDDLFVGFSFGVPLSPDTGWWSGLRDPVEDELTNEYPGRTFAIIELAVLAPYRRRGIGESLHNKLLERRTEERVTLLSRADAAPARSAYSAWGYQDVGRVQPGKDAPVYVAMIRRLPLAAS